MSIEDLFKALKSQGFHGHEGRPGKRGGSLPKGGGGSSGSIEDQLDKVLAKLPKEFRSELPKIPTPTLKSVYQNTTKAYSDNLKKEGKGDKDLYNQMLAMGLELERRSE